MGAIIIHDNTVDLWWKESSGLLNTHLSSSDMSGLGSDYDSINRFMCAFISSRFGRNAPAQDWFILTDEGAKYYTEDQNEISEHLERILTCLSQQDKRLSVIGDSVVGMSINLPGAIEGSRDEIIARISQAENKLDTSELIKGSRDEILTSISNSAEQINTSSKEIGEKQSLLIDNFTTWAQMISNEISILSSLSNGIRDLSSEIKASISSLESVNSTFLKGSAQYENELKNLISETSKLVEQSSVELSKISNYYEELKIVSKEDVASAYQFGVRLDSVQKQFFSAIDNVKGQLDKVVLSLSVLDGDIHNDTNATSVEGLKTITETLVRLSTCLDSIVSRDSDNYGKFVSIYNNTFDSIRGIISDIRDSLDLRSRVEEKDVESKTRSRNLRAIVDATQAVKNVKDVVHKDPLPEAPIVL